MNNKIYIRRIHICFLCLMLDKLGLDIRGWSDKLSSYGIVDPSVGVAQPIPTEKSTQ